ncbi:MAG: acyl-CoA dehydrogenase [Geminicoccaceae bacterium]|nr:acyl-CoA dehydrogenase [Geminicoccaceae bacterium]
MTVSALRQPPEPALSFDADLERCADAIRQLSPPAEQECPAAPMVAELRRHGLLAAAAPAADGGLGLAHEPEDPLRLVRMLTLIGRANLSAGRLLEGHVNALKLVAIHAEGEARSRLLGVARSGGLFGVWGAEGPHPVRLAPTGDGRLELTGEKLFASGADTVDVAVVTAKSTDGTTLLVALPTATLAGRLFPGEWSVSGMKATASGRCNLDGVCIDPNDLLGGPDAYFREPWFEGGVWRYAAVQLGGMYAIAGHAADQLRARRQATAPLQAARLRRMVTACETARLWVASAALATEAPAAQPATARVAVLARLEVAEAAVRLLQLADEAMGAASFALAHPAERVRRDLQLYLRQADPDGMGQRAMERILDDDEERRRWGIG